MNPVSGWVSLSFRNQILGLIVLGGAFALALPPIFFIPALIPGFVALYASLQGAKNLKQAFWCGWALGFGYFVTGLYWLGHAIAVDLATFWWAMPFALFGLQSLLAIFYGLTSLVTFMLARRFDLKGWGFVLMLVFCWLSMDLLRSFIFTGFPWNLLGTVMAGHPVLMQLASIGGVHLLTVLVLLWALAAGLCFDVSNRKSALAVFVLMPILVVGHGTMRIKALDETASQTVPNVQVRVVQANITQSLKWDPDLGRENLQKHVDLSLAVAEKGVQPNLIIWPETALPFALNRSTESQVALAEAVLAPNLSADFENEAVLIAGGNRVVGSGQDIQIWNHLYALNQSGELVAGYDKHHLVPFGEYMPFGSVLSALKLTPGNINFSEGAGPQTLALKGLPSFSPIICYEGIFSGSVTDQSHRPEWLLSITNDGWFGLSSGPHQHLAATILRAVEEGMPLVRASNPGVSTVTDALGRQFGHLPLGTAGYFDSKLPVVLQHPPLYANLGLKAVYLILLMLLVGVVASAKLNPRRDK